MAVAIIIVIEYTLHIYLKPKSTFHSGSSRSSDFLLFSSAAIFLSCAIAGDGDWEKEGVERISDGIFRSSNSLQIRFFCMTKRKNRSNRYFTLVLSFSIRLFKLNGLYDHKRCLFHVWQTFSFAILAACAAWTFEHSLHIASAHPMSCGTHGMQQQQPKAIPPSMWTLLLNNLNGMRIKLHIQYGNELSFACAQSKRTDNASWILFLMHTQHTAHSPRGGGCLSSHVRSAQCTWN